MAYYGLDIGGTKIETAVFDDDLQLLKSWRIATPTTNYAAFLAAIHSQVEIADSITGTHGDLGIGMPGLINNLGQVLSANVPCATNKYIAKDLQSVLKRVVAIKNDTRWFALSESCAGAGENYQRVFGAILGTGAAGGLCVNKKLEQTLLGIAGEFGHIPLPAELQKRYQLPILTCGCGSVGCVESYITGPGISRLYQHFGGQNISAKRWGELLITNEQRAHQVLTCLLDLLGNTFAVLVKLIEPDAIILGGGVSLVDQIIEQLPLYIEKHLFSGFSSPVILRAKFGDSSGVRGAALLAKQLKGVELCNESVPLPF